jgi:hypothetical protein
MKTAQQPVCTGFFIMEPLWAELEEVAPDRRRRGPPGRRRRVLTGTSDAMRAKMRAVFDNLLRHARREPLPNVVPELADLSLPASG